MSAAMYSCSIGDVADVRTGPFGSTLHQSDYVQSGTPIVTVEHLGERGLIHKNLPLVSDADVKRLAAYRCNTGDILFSRVGSIDRNSLVSSQEEGWLFSGRLLRLRVDRRRAEPAYLSQLFQTREFKDRVRSVAVGQTMPSLNTGLLTGIRVDLPDVETQRAAAQALVDADDLFASFERLIAKKRDIKQGLMQELLTGRTRLPGFSGEWVESTIGSLARAVGGGTPSTRVPAYWGGEIPWFTPAEIGASGTGLVSKSERSITRDGLANSGANLLPAGTVLVTSRASIGHTAVAAAPVATNQGFASLVPNNQRSTWFLYYWIQQNTAELESRSAGSTFLEISARKVGAIPIKAPSLDEQDTIGRTIRDADAEIEALERRLEATRAIKQGMMQELLTGRTRLVPSEVPA